MLPVHARRCCALSLTACMLFLTACAQPPQMPPADLPKLPPRPFLTTPLPETPYSTTAEQRMQGWSKKLMGTQLMSEPSAKPGQ